MFTEDESGRFGPNELSDTLTADSPVSVKKIVELFGGMVLRVASELDGAVRTGQPQMRTVFNMEFWEYLNANPKELQEFGEAMKSNSLNSLRGVLKHCDFSQARKVADVGGGFGHMALALVEKYSHLEAIVLDRHAVVRIARQHLPVDDPAIAEDSNTFRATCSSQFLLRTSTL